MNNILEYKGYNGSVEFSPEDNILFGKVIGIRSLISYEGESVQELKADFEAAVDDYLELCEAKGIQPEKTYINVRYINAHLNLLKPPRAAKIAPEWHCGGNIFI